MPGPTRQKWRMPLVEVSELLAQARGAKSEEELVGFRGMGKESARRGGRGAQDQRALPGPADRSWG